MPSHSKRTLTLLTFPPCFRQRQRGLPQFPSGPSKKTALHTPADCLSILLIVTFLNLYTEHYHLVMCWQNIMTKLRQVAFLYNLVSFPSVGNHPLFSFSDFEIYNPFPFTVVALLCYRIPEPFSRLTRFRCPASCLSLPPFSSLSRLKGLLFYSLLLVDQL